MPALSPAAADSARGVLMAMACGEALGAPYEFGPPLEPDHPVGMVGGGAMGWEPDVVEAARAKLDAGRTRYPVEGTRGVAPEKA